MEQHGAVACHEPLRAAWAAIGFEKTRWMLPYSNARTSCRRSATLRGGVSPLIAAISVAATMTGLHNAAGGQFADYMVDLLAPLGFVATKRFFGGIGLYRDAILFGMIWDETLYFRVDAASRPHYEAAGGQPFRYETKTGPRVIAGFFTVPEGLFEEPDELCGWARTAITAVSAAKASKAARKRSR
jgi:DNA transformation protein